MTPAPSEAKEQRALSAWARQQWWARGYVHHEQAIESKWQAHKRHRQGVRRGYPDVTVDVPGGPSYYASDPNFADAPRQSVPAILHTPPAKHLAVELKRASLRPKRRAGLWWLAWARELEADESWHLNPSEPTRHGLKASQAERLAYMQACGWETFVAYGWNEARAWLEAQIGERR